MPRRTTTCIAGLCAIMAGCSRRSYEGDPRYPVSGTVTVNSELIDAGTISFIPQFEKGRVSGGTILDGKYSVEEARGANAGLHRVEIRWQKKTGRQMRDPYSGEIWDIRAEGLPDKYHANSDMTADVSESQTRFDFDLRIEE